MRASTAAAEQPRPQAATLGEAGGLRARRAAARAAARQGVHACARVLPMHARGCCPCTRCRALMETRRSSSSIRVKYFCSSEPR